MRDGAGLALGHVAWMTGRRSTLLALCLVCKATYQPAARCLYRSAEVSRTLRPFVRTTSRSPKLAAFVHELSLVNAGLSEDSTRLLAAALKFLPHLRRIALPPLEHVIKGEDCLGVALAALPRLDAVLLQRAGERTQLLAQKLGRLRVLQLHWGLQSLGDLEPGRGCGLLLLACQDTLEELNIHGFDLASFLEARPAARWPRVRALTLLSTTNVDEALVSAFPNVERLVLRDLDLPAEILADARAWPRLRQLTLSVPNLIDGEPDAKGRVRALDRFSVWNTPTVDAEFIMEQLRYYDLARLSALQFYSGSDFSPALVRTICEACPCLRMLGIRFDSPRSNYVGTLLAADAPRLQFLSLTLSNYVYRPPDPRPIAALGRHFPALKVVDFIVMRTAAVQWRLYHHEHDVEVLLVDDAEYTAGDYWEWALEVERRAATTPTPPPVVQ